MAKSFEIEDGFVEDQNRKLKYFVNEDYERSARSSHGETLPSRISP